jgi:hypothetical protein
MIRFCLVFTDRALRFKSAITSTISDRVKIRILSIAVSGIVILVHFAELWRGSQQSIDEQSNAPVTRIPGSLHAVGEVPPFPPIRGIRGNSENSRTPRREAWDVPRKGVSFTIAPKRAGGFALSRGISVRSILDAVGYDEGAISF